jgi:hypothetical protein
MVNSIRFLSLTLLLAIQSFSALADKALQNDKAIMSQARGLYEKGKLDKAIETYSKIQASSDFWLESLEERAWAHTRKGDFESALADLHSITSPVFAPQVGPETYMLSTFVSLKICAYKDVVKKINHFKKMILPRVETLENIVNEPQLTDELWSSLQTLKDKQITLLSLGKQADKLPRYFFRDKKLIALIKQNKKDKAFQRVRDLAQMDLNEIEINLKKMKIIDVEIIQKVLSMDKDSKNESKNLKFTNTDPNKTMTFPVNDEEIWIDEVGHFQVKANLCPKAQGVSL